MRRLILFAPGAGAPSSHPWIRNWKQRLSEIGVVETFDYDYMRTGRKRPEPLPQLIATHRKALQAARDKYHPDLTLLIGKSMGGRIGCHLSLEEKVDGLVCLGYPLCAMGARTEYINPVCARYARFAVSAGSSGARSRRDESAELFARGRRRRSLLACAQAPASGDERNSGKHRSESVRSGRWICRAIAGMTRIRCR